MSYAGATYLSTILSYVSTDLVAGLSVMGLPALTDGGIVFGPAASVETQAPPRVVFEPAGLRFGPPDTSMVSHVVAGSETAKRADLIAAWASRCLGTAFVSFKVTCWGVSDTTVGANPTPIADFDASDALMRAVVRSVRQVVPGGSIEDGGSYSQTPGDASLMRDGWVVRFGLTIPTPIVDYPIDYAPVGTAMLPVFPQT